MCGTKEIPRKAFLLISVSSLPRQCPCSWTTVLRLTRVEPRHAKTGIISARFCFVAWNTTVYLHSSSSSDQKFCLILVPGSLCRRFFSFGEARICRQAVAFQKWVQSRWEKATSQTVTEFDSRQPKNPVLFYYFFCFVSFFCFFTWLYFWFNI